MMDQPSLPCLGTDAATRLSQPEGARGSDGGASLGRPGLVKAGGSRQGRLFSGQAGCGRGPSRLSPLILPASYPPAAATGLWSTPDLRARRRFGMWHPQGLREGSNTSPHWLGGTCKSLPNPIPYIYIQADFCLQRQEPCGYNFYAQEVQVT